MLAILFRWRVRSCGHDIVWPWRIHGSGNGLYHQWWGILPLPPHAHDAIQMTYLLLCTSSLLPPAATLRALSLLPWPWPSADVCSSCKGRRARCAWNSFPLLRTINTMVGVFLQLVRTKPVIVVSTVVLIGQMDGQGPPSPLTWDVIVISLPLYHTNWPPPHPTPSPSQGHHRHAVLQWLLPVVALTFLSLFSSSLQKSIKPHLHRGMIANGQCCQDAGRCRPLLFWRKKWNT